MGLAHEKKSYLQEKANLFEIGSIMKIYRKLPQIQALSRLFQVSFVITLRFDP